MFAFLAPFLTGPVYDDILDIYDYIQQLPLLTLILPPTSHIRVFAVLGNRPRVPVPRHLQPAVAIALSGIRSMQVSGMGSSMEAAVDAFIRRFQQINYPEETQFPLQTEDWQHWLTCRQHLNLVISPFPGNSRWSWISRRWGNTDFNLNVLYELARLASCETLDPQSYPLPVPFFRFATLVVVLHEQMHLIAKHVFGGRLTLVFDEAVPVRYSGGADEAFQETILGGLLVGEWTSQAHVGQFEHLHGLLIRNTLLGKDYALSLADVTRFLETVTTATARTLTPLFLKQPSPLQGGHIRTVLLKPVQNIIDYKLVPFCDEKDITRVAGGSRVRTPAFTRCHLYRTAPEDLL